jgi:hypothetical protein
MPLFFDKLKAALISRLTCALGYSAYDLIRTILISHQTLLIGLVPLFACGAVYCKRIEGLQILFAILAAQGLLPVPHEPAAAAVWPNVLLYFAVFSIVRSQLLLTDTLSEQFMALSLNARALSYFKSADQVTEAAVMSVAYLAVMHCSRHLRWKVVDCFATRSAALWIASFFEPDALLFFLMFCPESGVTSIMGLKCAQQLIGRTSEAEAMLVMIVILLFFNDRLRGVSTCGISILAVKRLEESIKEWNHAESAAVYMCAFCLLQICKGQGGDAEKNSIIIIAHEEADDFLLLLQL